MAKNITLDDFLDFLAEKVADRLGTAEPAENTGKASKSRGRAKAEPDDEDEDDDNDNADRIAELKKTNIRTLRKMAIALGFDEEEVAEAEKDTLAESIADAESEDGDDEGDDEPDEDEDDDEDDERERLEGLSLPALKKEAKEAGFSASDLKGQDKDSIIEMLLEESDEDDDDEDNDEDEDDDSMPSEDELNDMSLAELKALCKEYGIKVPRGAKEDDLVELLLAEDE